MIVIASYRALRHGRYPAFPGTSCQATFTPSLRDKPLLAKTRNRRQVLETFGARKFHATEFRACGSFLGFCAGNLFESH
jgi:hypothetical protein